MGLLSGSFTCRRYQVLHQEGEGFREACLVRLREFAFQEPLSAAKKGETFGWVSVHNLTDIDFTPDKVFYSQYFTFALRSDIKRLPSRLFRALLDNECQKWMASTGREKIPAPVKRELRDRLELSLLPRHLPTVSAVEVMWDLSRNELLFFSLSGKVNDTFRKLFSRTFQVHLRPLGPVRLGLLQAQEGEDRLAAFDAASVSVLFSSIDDL